MHRLSDTEMITRTSKPEDFWLAALAALDTLAGRHEATKGTV